MKVVVVGRLEPGPFATDFLTDSSLKQATPIAVYDAAREQFSKVLTPEMFGDPKATSAALLQVVDSDQPPLHFILGPLLPMVKQVYAARMQTWEAWDHVSRAAHGRAAA